MKESLFVLSILAVTVYLTVAAWEDYKTCEVTRWKHLIGGIPAICLLGTKYGQYSWQEYAMILAFAFVFVLAGCIRIYGMADGYVFMILTLFLGSMGGVAGIGIVILIMITAGFSFLIHHLVKCMIKRKKLLCNMAAALIPHILIGYGMVWAGIFIYAA